MVKTIGNNDDRSFDENGKNQMQLVILSVGVFFFFGVHNIVQEAITKEPGFRFGLMLGYLEVLGVTVCSYFERTFVAKERGRAAPLSAYPLITVLLMSSSSFVNLSLNYINFPTKVVFRSCKLIPTMIIASMFHKKIFSRIEYLCAFAICSGLIFFAAADWSLTPSFNPLGIALVSLSVCADAALPNAQEQLFKIGASRLEVTFYTNALSLVAMTGTTLLSGDFMGLCKEAMNSSHLCKYLIAYTFISYMAISMHMAVVKRFGGVTAVLVAMARKIMTLVLSFILFPKAFSWLYVSGAALVLGGMLISSLNKMSKNRGNVIKQPHLQLDVESNSNNAIIPPSMNNKKFDAEQENDTQVIV